MPCGLVHLAGLGDATNLLDERWNLRAGRATERIRVLFYPCAGGGQQDRTPGVGIDAADLPRVFDIAYRGSNHRVPRSDSSLPSGSGLGLAIAAGLVRAHRGTLSAHNLTSGARFEVRLPLAAA